MNNCAVTKINYAEPSCKKRTSLPIPIRVHLEQLTADNLIADYERRNFSVSQCSWNAGARQEIIAMISPVRSYFGI